MNKYGLKMILSENKLYEVSEKEIDGCYVLHQFDGDEWLVVDGNTNCYTNRYYVSDFAE